MQAIITKFFGPTNSRPARIKVTCDAITKVFSVDDFPPGHGPVHDAAAERVATELGWLEGGWELAGGGMPGNTGNCYVLVRR